MTASINWRRTAGAKVLSAEVFMRFVFSLKNIHEVARRTTKERTNLRAALFGLVDGFHRFIVAFMTQATENRWTEVASF